MSHSNLSNYYENNFTLHDSYNFSITELENMIPFERDVYITLIKAKQEKERKNG